MQEKTKAGGMREIDLEDLSLMDNVFMKACFHENIKATQKVVNIILGRSDIRIVSVTGQAELPNLHGGEAVLDVWAKDSKGKLYNIEVQKGRKGAGAKRARRNSSLMDANFKEPGEYGEKLPESYILFITERDVLRGEVPVYSIERRIKEQSFKAFGDGSHIVYVNASYKDSSTDIGKLIHDFKCKKPEEMYFEELSEKPKRFKRTKEGKEDMKSMYDRNIEAAIKQGKTEGRKEGRVEGRKEGRMEGRREGRNEGVEAALDVVTKLGIKMTPEQLEAARKLAMA